MHNAKLIRLSCHREKPLALVPALIIVILLMSFSAQVAWRMLRPDVTVVARQLPHPPPLDVLRLASFGEEAAVSGLLMLWLQSFDNQPGISIPLKALDYKRLRAWLNVILALHPKGQYPLLSAARIYSLVQDEDKKLIMLNFIYENYRKEPNLRWPALAHATFIAKHKLKNLPLALQYARALRQHTTDKNAPAWVRQMELFVLEDMGEHEAAQILLGGLMENGVIKDQREFQFLQERLGLDK